jgi:hypothetical protein
MISSKYTDRKSHNHEEADQLIVLHALDAIKKGDVHIYAADTDISVMLLDMCANRNYSNTIYQHTRQGRFDINELCRIIGTEKCKGLIGFHNFKGTDWGGKFIGVSTSRWTKAYLNLDKDNDIVSTFQKFGTQSELNTDDYDNVQQFVCMIYSKSKDFMDVGALRWHLFQTHNYVSEKLPPTFGSLVPHIKRCNAMSRVYKSYVCAKPSDVDLVGGWEKDDLGKNVPIKCIALPAPEAILELTKCACKGQCIMNRCSCYKDKLNCTPLCKCNDCKNIKDYQLDPDLEGENFNEYVI